MPHSKARPAARADSTNSTTLGILLPGSGGALFSAGKFVVVRQRLARSRAEAALRLRDLVGAEVDKFTRMANDIQYCAICRKADSFLFRCQRSEAPSRKWQSHQWAHSSDPYDHHSTSRTGRSAFAHQADPDGTVTGWRRQTRFRTLASATTFSRATSPMRQICIQFRRLRYSLLQLKRKPASCI